MRHLVTCLFVASLAAAACTGDGGTVRITTQDVNVTTPEDTAISVTVAAQANVQNVSAELTKQPTHGTVTNAGSTYTYTPTADFNGADTLEVTFTSGTESAVATVNITIAPVDDAPVAGPDSFAAAFNTNVSIQTSALLENDTDKDSTTLSVTGVQSGTHGGVTMSGDSITFTPEANFQGAAAFTYILSDGSVTAHGDVTVNVGTNNAPVAVNDASTTPEDTVLTIARTTLLANDTDADHNTLMLASVGGAVHGAVVIQGTNVVFTPEANYSGAASFTYGVTDGADTATGTVAVTVTPVNDAPVAAADTATTNEDTAVQISSAQLTANDSDIDSAVLTVSAVSGATNGTATLAGGVVTFTPALNFNGAASFTYTVSDGSLTANSTVTVTVLPVNDAPVAVDDLVAGAEDTLITIATATLTANDVDVDQDALTVTSISQPSIGSAVLSNGSVLYTPPANFNGLVTFNYTVTDGILTDVGAVMLMVTPVNDAPVATNDAVQTNEDTPVSVSVLVNDTDLDGDMLTIQSFTQGSHGTVTFSNGVALYSPSLDYNGPDSFTYTALDAGGAISSATVTVTVLPVNDAPTARVDAFSLAEDTQADLDVLANDTDPENQAALALTNVTPAAHGTASLLNNKIHYVPNADYNGPDSVTYTVSDGVGGVSTAVVSITVTPVNDAPTPMGDTYNVAEGATLTVDASQSVLLNDTDIDSVNLTALLATGPSYGVLDLQPNGAFTYTPSDPFATEDTFTYFASDGALQTAATVTIVINQAPCPSDDYYQYDFYAGGLFPSVLNNDYDNENDPLTATLNTPPDYALSFSFNADGTFTYVADFSFDASYDYFYYDVTDGYSTVASVQVAIQLYCSKCFVGAEQQDSPLVDADLLLDRPMDGFVTQSRCFCQGVAAGRIALQAGGPVLCVTQSPTDAVHDASPSTVLTR